MPRSKKDKKAQAENASITEIYTNGGNGNLVDSDFLSCFRQKRRENQPTVFVDLDGTLVDFEQGVSELGVSTRDAKKMWDAISDAPRFWRSLPWLPDGSELWIKLQPLRPVVLTGLPGGTQRGGAALRKRAEDQKRAWCRDNLGLEVVVLCVDSRDKHKFSAPGCILVDDNEQLRESWERSGGYFVLRQGVADTLALVEAALSQRITGAIPSAPQCQSQVRSVLENKCHAMLATPTSEAYAGRRNEDSAAKGVQETDNSMTHVDSTGLEASFCKLVLTEASHAKRASLISAIRRMVVTTFQGQFEACLVGSSGAGLADATSDLDFALVPCNMFLGGEEGGGTSTVSEQQLLEQLARSCEKECGLKVEVVLTRSKAPDLVKCVDPKTGIQCDMVVRHGDNGALASVDKAMLLRSFVDASSLFRPLVRTVKLWARARQLIDPVNGKLNSFTWTLMTAFFMQVNGLLPVPDCSKDAMRKRRLVLCTGAPPMETEAAGISGAHLLVLLQAFFAYWVQFDYRASCACVQHGSCTDASSDMPVKSSKTTRSTQDSRRAFLVQDPVEPDENTARTLSDHNLVEVRAELNRALLMFKEGHPWDKICQVPTVKKSKELKRFLLPERLSAICSDFSRFPAVIASTRLSKDTRASVCKLIAEMPCGVWHELPQRLTVSDRRCLQHCLNLFGIECRRVGNTDAESEVELFKLAADEVRQRVADQPLAWTHVDRDRLQSAIGSVPAPSSSPSSPLRSSSQMTRRGDKPAATIIKCHSCLVTVQKLREGVSLEDLQNKYKLIVKDHPELGLVQLSYSQTESQMASPVVQECRGLILETETWNVVALPFRKFFNYGEKYAQILDWEAGGVRVYEKLDGSLLTLYWYNQAWHVATSKLPAANGVLPNSSMTFADMFWQVWREKSYKLPTNTNMCYMFELLTPNHTIIVRHAQADLVCIGGRDIRTLEEIPCEKIVEATGWHAPRRFDELNALDVVVAAARSLNPVIQEGFVVVDQHWRRVKVKCASYVALHHLGGNYDRGGSSALDDRGRRRSLIQIARNNEGDEFLAYYSELEQEFREILSTMCALEKLLEDGGGGTSGSEKQNTLQRFSKKMRQDGLSAKDVIQQAKITDVESALDLVPADALGCLPISQTSRGSETIATRRPAVTSQLTNSRVKAPSADLVAKLTDDIEPNLGKTHSEEKNRFQALLMEDSSDSDE